MFDALGGRHRVRGTNSASDDHSLLRCSSSCSRAMACGFTVACVANWPGRVEFVQPSLQHRDVTQAPVQRGRFLRGSRPRPCRTRQGTIDDDQVGHSHELIRYEPEFRQVLMYGLIDLRCLNRGIELWQKRASSIPALIRIKTQCSSPSHGAAPRGAAPSDH